MNIFALCLAVLTSLFALITLLKKKMPLFYQIVVFGSWCYLLAVVYRVLYAALIPTPAFHAGYLAYAGTFFFLLSAYFSEPRGAAVRKQRKSSLIALIPSIVIAAWGVWNVHLGYDILPQLLLIPVVLTAYFACKCLGSPKEDTGFIAAMRLYNGAVLVLCLLQPIILVAMLTREHTAIPIFLTSTLSAVSVALAYRGCRKWHM